jgi:beta-lactam-binding protein with PASTA domain
MAKCFQISSAAKTTFTLDSQGKANFQITAKNVTGAACDGRAVAVSIPVTTPPSGAAQNGWIKIDAPEQRFERDQEKVFAVKVEVPAKDKKPGQYQFAVDVVLVSTPDVGDRSPTFAFTVPETMQKQSHFPLWIIPVALLVVIALGVGLWLALRPKPSSSPTTSTSSSGLTVPDLHGKTLSEADDILKRVDLVLDQNNVQTVESKPEDSDKVIDQKPAALQNAPKGTPIQVTVGAQMVAVPQLIGVPYNQVLGMLAEKKLLVGQTTVTANPSFTSAIVWGQTPPAQQVVKSGTTVNLTVTPQMVPVPNVIGQTLGNAIYILNRGNLTVTPSFSGDNTQPVSSQDPPGGAPVPVGSPVTLAFPFVRCWGGFNCIATGVLAQTKINQQLRIAIRDLEQQKEAPPKQKVPPHK